MSSTRKRDQTTASTAKSVNVKTNANTRKSPVKRKRHFCSFCCKDFDKKNRLLGHHQKRHSEQLHCVLCNITFKREIQYQAHLKKHSNPFECKVCYKLFCSQSLLNTHSKIHCKTWMVKKGRIECKECDSSFIKQKTLITHMLKFHNLLQCPDCEEYFTQTAGLRAHNNACHSLKRMSGDAKVKTKVNEECHQNLECEFCRKGLPTEPELMSHMTLLHKGLKCAKCDVWCKGKMSLINHVKNCKKKPKVKAFNCHLCKKQFARIETLVSHIKPCMSKVIEQNKAKVLPRKRGRPPKCRSFRCDVCGKDFTTKALLAGHQDTCPRIFSCSVCAKTFSSEKALSSHVQIFHTGAKLYKCSVCNKRFPHLNILQVHTAMFHRPSNADIVPGVKAFTKKKTHKCRMCRKAFFQTSFLKMHMKTHTAEKRLMCGICGEKFSNDKAVIDHINIFHLTDRDRGNIENQEYVIECLNANGERWNGEDIVSNVTIEGQTDREDNTPSSSGHTVDHSVLRTATSEQVSVNNHISSNCSLSSKEGEHEQQYTVNSLNTNGAKTSGEMCTILQTLIERQPIKKEQEYQHDDVIPSTPNNIDMSNDQLNIYTDYLNHLPHQTYEVSAAHRSQGDSVLASIPLQYRYRKIDPHHAQAKEQHNINTHYTGTLVAAESCMPQENPLKKEDAERNLQCLELNCDDEEFYIVLNDELEENEEDFVKTSSKIDDIKIVSDLQLHSSLMQFQDVTYSTDCIKQEDSKNRLEIVETEIVQGTEDSSVLCSNIEQRVGDHGSGEWESKENMKQYDQRMTPQTENRDSVVGCGQSRSGISQKCVSDRSHVYMCGVCQQGFCSAEDLNQHKMSSHSLRCTQCGQEYMRMIDLVTHYESCMGC